VKWLQQVGRITRPVEPGEPVPEYICTNRNIQRHCYLFDGAIPDSVIKEVQAAFKVPSRRAGSRAIGLESIGRFSPAEVTTKSGIKCAFYTFSAVEGTQVRQYATIVHPARVEPVWATRVNEIKEDGSRGYGRWQRLDVPPVDVTGFKSMDGSPVSEKQLAWWKRAASGFGLDRDAIPNRKQFGVLPVLVDLHMRLT
jgi:hypothetical protein